MAQPVGSTAVVPVKSAMTSKINWIQIIGAIAMIGSYFGLNLTPEQVAGLVTAIGAGQSIITFIVKTFFSKSVVSSST